MEKKLIPRKKNKRDQMKSNLRLKSMIEQLMWVAGQTHPD